MNEKDKLDLITRRTIGAAIDQLAPIHDAQLLSYLRMSGMRVRLLLNFHV
ncbi:MAG TPA: GxxExxY protein [Candidatus Acidoferrum sp.]|nr:GxxExxY protein [Candidatus Acidoferrum sp.]